MEEQFLHGYLLRNGAVWIAIPLHAFHLALPAHSLDIRLQDGLIAHHPDHLVDDAGLWGCRLFHDGVGGYRLPLEHGPLVIRHRGMEDAPYQRNRCDRYD